MPEKYYLSRKQAEKLLYKEKPTQGERTTHQKDYPTAGYTRCLEML